jgi:hypothetical protein
MHDISGRAAAVLIVGCASLASAAAMPADPALSQTAGAEQAEPAQKPREHVRVNEDARISADFMKRVREYADLHKRIEGKLPKLSDEASPTDIDHHQRELGRLMEQARPNAQPGDLFTKESRAYFRRQMQRVFAGADGRQLKASIMDENPGPIRLRINGRYPDTVPLSTMPSQVLLSLPKLPEELEYRFIGDRLILLDVHAHTIVDYIDDALPK